MQNDKAVLRSSRKNTSPSFTPTSTCLPLGRREDNTLGILLRIKLFWPAGIFTAFTLTNTVQMWILGESIWTAIKLRLVLSSTHSLYVISLPLAPVVCYSAVLSTDTLQMNRSLHCSRGALKLINLGSCYFHWLMQLMVGVLVTL